MAKIHVTGNGPLRGVVSIAGAKNAALPVIAASLLSEEPLELSNVPAVKDIDTSLQLLELLGVVITAGMHMFSFSHEANVVFAMNAVTLSCMKRIFPSVNVWPIQSPG